MRFAPFLAEREARRARALAASAALAGGDRRAAGTALTGFRFGPGHADVVIDALLDAPPTPTDRHVAAALIDAEHLPADDEDVAPPVRRRRYEGAKLAGAPAHAGAQLAWALESLSFVASEVERVDRAAWQAVKYAPDADDAKVGAAWARWFESRPWDIRSTWEGWFVKDAVIVFRAVGEARRLPPDVMKRAVSDLREAMFYALVGKESPGWADVASRVIESGGLGPVDALASALGGEGWNRVASCAASRGNWPDTVAKAFADLPGMPPRALALKTRGQADPRALEGLLDLHVALRILAGWREGSTAFDDARAVVSQNRGRARARLRAALLATGRETLLDTLRKMPGLRARTAAAIRRWAWSWAWQELASDFAFDLGHVVTPPCEDGGEVIEPIAGEDEAIATWMLLVTLKGKLAALQKWVRTGSAGDRDSTWGRLLTDELPDRLRDASVGGRAATYHRLRATLNDSLPERTRALVPSLRVVAALKAGRAVRAEFTARFEAGWHPEVPFPKAGFPTFIDNAAAALDALAVTTEDPCT